MSISDSFLYDFEQRAMRSLLSTNFGEPVFASRIEDIILKKFDGIPKPPESTDLESLLFRIKAESNPNFNKRERKWLPWILFYGESPRLAEIPDKINYILYVLSNPFRVSYIKGMIHAYLGNYDPDQQGCERIRKFIWDKLSGLSEHKITPSIKLWRNLKTPIFLPNGHHQTANVFLKNKGEIHQTLLEYGFDNDLGTSKFIKFVSSSIIEKTKNTFPVNLDKCMAINEIPGHPPRPKFKDLIVRMASGFLPKAGLDVEMEIKETLSTYLLRHLSDPRIPGNEIRWRGVGDEGKRIFCQWLSSKDLEFFFNIVDRSSADTKWKYRRKFWEAYLPYIENTWVILGRNARQMAEQVDSNKFHFDLKRYGQLTDSSSSQSAFLIQMGGYIFVEWNDAGACRVWDRNECPFKFSQPIYSSNDLRGQNFEDRFRHYSPERYGWQDEMRGWIRDKTSIFIESKDYKL